MMKPLYLRLLVIIALSALTNSIWSQLAPVPYYIETIVHNGDYGDAGHDLSGYVTYRVYIQFDAPGNHLTSVFASEGFQDCVQDPDSTVFFEFPCGLFQHEFGTDLGFDQLCLPFLGATLTYDSYLTIGQECSDQANCDITGPLGACPEWVDSFNGTTGDIYGGGGFFWDEFALYAINACGLGYPNSLSGGDANNRVLIGQFTTCGDMNGCVNIQYRDPAGVDHVVLNVCFSAEMPCQANGMDNTPTIDLADCADQATSVSLSGGGNGVIDYTIFNAATDTPIDTYLDQNGTFTIDPLEDGSYYITMEDAIGCRDTTADFSVDNPDPIIFDAELLTDVLCFGETTGSIEVTCSGGTGSILVTAANQQFNCGDIISNLGCGDYVITATDDNNCQESETISVACPEEIEFTPAVTSIVCFGYDDGSISGSVEGGTGNLDVTWTLNTGFFEDFAGNSPLNVSLDPIDEGVYAIEVVDANGCIYTDEFEITEPDEYLATPTVTDATCFDYCDGTVSYEIVGGTEPYNVSGTPTVGGGAVNLNQLCDGEYAIVISDDNNCIINDTITIVEPSQIVYGSLEIQPVSCFGECDGIIAISDVEGSWGGYSYSITPDVVTCTPPCSGSSVTFTDICSGNYDVTVTDQNGCFIEINAIEIESPDPIQIVFDPTDITCFGYNNGEVVVDVIGGTAPVIITPSDSIAPYTFTDLAPGLYAFTVTDANGCTSDADVIINEPPLLVATVDSLIDPTCGGACDGSLLYTPTGGTLPYEYVLLPTGSAGVANGTINSLCAGDYQLVLFDLYNCTDTTDFTLTEPDPLVIDVLLDAPTCTGMFDGAAEINISGGTGDLTLFIEPDDLNSVEIDSVNFIISELGEGEIYFELEDEEGCRLLDTLEVIPDIITDMVLSLFSTPETCWNEFDGTATVAVQNGNPPINYQWDDNNSQTTATAVGLGPNQDYTVVVTDDIGCTLTASVFVEATEGCFFIATAITPNGDGVNDTWILGGLEYFSNAKINVFNRWGQLVFSSTGYSANWDGTFQGELLPVADYYFTIDYADDKDPIMGTVTIKY